MASTISFGPAHSGLQAAIINGLVNTEFHQHAPPERPETPPDPTVIIPFSRDTDFVERGTILDQIYQKCAVSGSRTALVGLGGVGKSQLAIEYAYRTRDRSSETWVFWVHASNAARFEQSFRDIANCIKISGRQNPQANIFQLVHDWLHSDRKGKWVLILDNVDDAGFLVKAQSTGQDGQTKGIGSGNLRPLVAYLPQCSNGSILITTRCESAALKLVEQRDIIAVTPMGRADAPALLERKLRWHDNGEDAVKLAAALAFMPFAIVQAAAYISQRGPRYSVQEYLQDFRKSDRKGTGLLNHEVEQLRRDSGGQTPLAMYLNTPYSHEAFHFGLYVEKFDAYEVYQEEIHTEQDFPIYNRRDIASEKVSSSLKTPATNFKQNADTLRQVVGQTIRLASQTASENNPQAQYQLALGLGLGAGVTAAGNLVVGGYNAVSTRRSAVAAERSAAATERSATAAERNAAVAEETSKSKKVSSRSTKEKSKSQADSQGSEDPDDPDDPDESGRRLPIRLSKREPEISELQPLKQSSNPELPSPSPPTTSTRNMRRGEGNSDSNDEGGIIEQESTRLVTFVRPLPSGRDRALEVKYGSSRPSASKKSKDVMIISEDQTSEFPSVPRGPLTPRAGRQHHSNEHWSIAAQQEATATKITNEQRWNAKQKQEDQLSGRLQQLRHQYVLNETSTRSSRSNGDPTSTQAPKATSPGFEQESVIERVDSSQISTYDPATNSSPSFSLLSAERLTDEMMSEERQAWNTGTLGFCSKNGEFEIERLENSEQLTVADNGKEPDASDTESAFP